MAGAGLDVRSVRAVTARLMPKGSSSRWLERQRKDQFVKQAQDQGWRSRAVFKLMEIDQRDRLIRPGQQIVDLGAAPGGWCQYAVKKLQGRSKKIVGLDLLPIEPLPGVEFIQGDFLESEILDRLSLSLENCRPDLVLSDMAPNFSGIKNADLARSYELAELACDFAVQQLASSGAFLVKVFQGGDFEAYRKLLQTHFTKVSIRKPSASRPESRELYFLAQGLRKAHNE